MRPTQVIFSDFGAPGNRNFGAPRMPWVWRESDNLGDFEPAGELAGQISEILGGILRILKILEGFPKKNQGFPRFWKDSQRIWEPQALIFFYFLWFLLIFNDFPWFLKVGGQRIWDPLQFDKNWFYWISIGNQSFHQRMLLTDGKVLILFLLERCPTIWWHLRP